MSEKAKKNPFETIYNEYVEKTTKEGFTEERLNKTLDKMLDHELDVHSKVVFWRLSLLIPFAVLTLQGIQLLKDFNLGLQYELFGEIVALIIWIWLAIDYRNPKSWDSSKIFNQYLDVMVKKKSKGKEKK